MSDWICQPITGVQCQAAGGLATKVCYTCVSYTLIVRYITSQLLCLLGYSGERSLGNSILWGMLLGSSTAVVKVAWLGHYLIPTLGD